MSAPVVVVTVYRDKARKWRWKACHGNARKWAVSGEAFASKRNARRAAQSVADEIQYGHVADYAEVVIDDG